MDKIRKTKLRSERTTIRCIQCNREIIVTINKSKHKKFCSLQCHLEYKKRNGEIKTCKTCGKSIYINPTRLKNNKNFYCSLQCASKGAKRRFNKRCQYCGKIFEVGGDVPKKQIFCSSKCFGSNNTLHNTSESNWKPKTKYFTQKCIYCGKEYNVWNYRKSQFCSQQCHFNYKHIKTKCLDCGKNIDKPIWVYNSGFTEKFCDDCRIKHSSKRSMFELTVYLNLLPLFNNINNKYVVSLINVKIYPDIVINDKFIIECMGDYWHCNPFYYDAGYLNKRMNKTASEIWKKDEKRKCILESLGYNVVNIWEKDWNENKEKCINKIRSIVNENDISKN